MLLALIVIVDKFLQTTQSINSPSYWITQMTFFGKSLRCFVFEQLFNGLISSSTRSVGERYEWPFCCSFLAQNSGNIHSIQFVMWIAQKCRHRKRSAEAILLRQVKIAIESMAPTRLLPWAAAGLEEILVLSLASSLPPDGVGLIV